MGGLTWVHPDKPLPLASSALKSPNGLVAVGTDLSVPRLIEAYRKGIFPWFNPGDPVLWWSPDPRMVLVPEQMHLSRSLRKKLRQIQKAQLAGDFRIIVTVDLAFDEVLEGCASRGDRDPNKTWITPEMKTVYQQWHRQGGVHSVEVWIDGVLAGGLYGVALGQMFFGESMFTRTSNASKIALAHLVAFFKQQGIGLIDCQMQTEHLASLGAQSIDRQTFIEHVTQAVNLPPVNWCQGWLNLQGELDPTLAESVVLPVQAIGYDQAS